MQYGLGYAAWFRLKGDFVYLRVFKSLATCFFACAKEASCKAVAAAMRKNFKYSLDLGFYDMS